jgi:hypothetical protein
MSRHARPEGFLLPLPPQRNLPDFRRVARSGSVKTVSDRPDLYLPGGRSRFKLAESGEAGSAA